jgi:hypothetical protein
MAIPEWQAIAKSTLGVVFFATPHAGSDLATFIRVAKLSRPTRTVLALTAHCPHLKELSDWYRQNATRLGIETVAYAESRKVRRGARWFMIVNTTSANPGIEGCISTSIDADHIDICKPESRETDAYRGIETFIRRQLKRIQSPNGPPPGAAGRSVVALPPGLVQQILEVQAMGDMKLLDPFEVKELKMGILSRHYYGASDD